MDRRELLLDQVTDHVLAQGLIGLTLRPVAAAIGTSDRMLIYHFGNRDALVSAVVARSGERAVAAVNALPGAPSVRSAVNRLWASYGTEPLNSCLDVYVQAAATGLFGSEPYLSEARASNDRWAAALRDYLVRSGAPVRRVARIVTLVDSALYGFHLDLATDRPDELARGVDDLARAAQSLAGWRLSFWAGVQGVEPHDDPDGQSMCRSIGSIGSVRLESQRTSDGTPARVHLDIETDDVPAEVARVVASAPLRRPHQAGDVFGRDKLTWELVRTLKRQPDMYRV